MIFNLPIVAGAEGAATSRRSPATPKNRESSPMITFLPEGSPEIGRVFHLAQWDNPANLFVWRTERNTENTT